MRGGRFVSRLDWYIFRQLALGLVAVTAGLTALIWLTQSLRFVKLVVDHGLSFGVFLELTGLLVPSFIAVVLPITTFVVIQFVYQRLAGDREITVMRAAGRSDFALARPALALALLATLAGYALNLWVVPASFRAFQNFQWEIRNRIAAFLLEDGVFTQISPGLTVYIRSRTPDGVLHGILINDARDPTAETTVLAREGRLIDGPKGPEVLLLDGSRQQIDPHGGRLELLTFRRNVLDLSTAGRSNAARLPNMAEVSVHTLLHPPSFVSAADRPRWVAEAAKRLSGPLSTIAYAAIALLSVLTGTFRRHGSAVRPLAAIGAVVVLVALELGVGDLAARSNALLGLVWVEATVPALIGLALLLGPEMWRRRPPSGDLAAGGGPVAP
ncbi:MAG: LPS export ABC transporter permease LptF [Acetobacteraceae bacterium]